MGTSFGIHLGGTSSAIACLDQVGHPLVIRNDDGELTTPTVVYFEGKDQVVIGKTAKESAPLFPDAVVSLVKRGVGNTEHWTFYGREYSAAGIAALILTALAQSARAATNYTVDQVVIAVPAYFRPQEKDATRQAGEIAGLEVIGIVPEPVVTALAYGATGSASGTVFVVYDLGGTTFDVTLIKMTGAFAEVLAVGGEHLLGGAEWDERLFDYLREQTIQQTGDHSLDDDEVALQELRSIAEDTKKALTRAESKKVLHRLVASTATAITITRQQFEEMTSDLLERTIMITNQMLQEADRQHPGIRDQISEVLMAGGSSLMPAVAERLRREFPWKLRLADPDLAVAKGAALYAANLSARIAEAAELDDEPGLLVSIYIPHDRLYAAEQRRVLTLFRDWLAKTRKSGIRQSEQSTSRGSKFDFFTDGSVSAQELQEEIDTFARVLDLCADSPAAALEMLSNTGMSEASAAQLVTEFRREARRVQKDIRQARESRMIALKQDLEDKLFEMGFDLQSGSISQIDAALNELLPCPDAVSSLQALAPPGKTHIPMKSSVTMATIKQSCIPVENPGCILYQWLPSPSIPPNAQCFSIGRSAATPCP